MYPDALEAFGLITHMNPPTTVIRSNKKYRIIMITLLLGLVVLGIGLIVFTNSYIQELEHIAQQAPDQALRDTGLLLLGITMLAGLPAVGIGAYLGYLGNQVLSTGQFPPPGTRVIVDTHVVQGFPAKVRGVLVMVLGSLVILCGLGLPIVVWRLIQTF